MFKQLGYCKQVYNEYLWRRKKNILNCPFQLRQTFYFSSRENVSSLIKSGKKINNFHLRTYLTLPFPILDKERTLT